MVSTVFLYKMLGIGLASALGSSILERFEQGHTAVMIRRGMVLAWLYVAGRLIIELFDTVQALFLF